MTRPNSEDSRLEDDLTAANPLEGHQEQQPPLDDEVQGGGSVPLHLNRNFRALWLGQALWSLGSNISSIAFPLLVLAKTGSPVLAGLIGTVRLGVGTIGRLSAGAVADRLNRRSLMIACDAVRCVTFALLAALILVNHVPWPLVLFAVAVESVGDILFAPAHSALLPVIVPGDQIAAASAAEEARQFGASIAGLPLGGVLFRLSAAAPFIADALSYLASLVAVSSLRGRFAVEVRPRQAIYKDVREGLRFTWETPLLRAALLIGPLLNLATLGVIYTVTIVMGTHGSSSSVIGFTQTFMAVGGLVGALLAPRLLRRFSLITLLASSTGFGALLIVVSGALAPSWLLGIPLLGVYLLFPASNAALFSAAITLTPGNLQGRMVSTMVFASTSLAAGAPIVGGFLVANTTPFWSIATFAAPMAAAAVITTRSPALRAPG